MSSLPNFLTSLLTLTTILTSSACASSKDCGLNGDCLESICSCDPAWTGPTCTTLNLIPLSSTSADNGVYKHDTSTSWGANVLFSSEDNLYHMYVSEMKNNCTLTSWIPNSQITHAVSKELTGPFEFKETLFDTFHHNPRLTYDPSTKQYLLFMIGGDLSSTSDCSGIPDSQGELYDTRIIYSSSKSLNGPWSIPSEPLIERGGEDEWDYVVTNPSPIIHEDGTTYLYYRGTPKYWDDDIALRGELPESVGVAVADNFWGPYSKPFDSPILSYMNEDPFAWLDPVRGYKMLTHGRDDPLNTHYAYSEDGLSWSSGADVACDANVTVEDDQIKVFMNRERPQIFFEGGQPSYLFNGVCPDEHYGYAYTIAQEINKK
ncbi:hypothetical protein TL16_g00918 [Triparma laevis f. inornata]|uniref:EGF-like domain-containing protein n=2 Tax=Triparma laevis TaxID=1534972 RepID=A0A9W7C118_9STRA|nr:hypothetical protein TL16_g00918 [Triparma laevis f. inornata]GMI00695.1 hypothetical protein TrLO_g8505 [Triparma laevis f. longispina]